MIATNLLKNGTQKMLKFVIDKLLYIIY